MNEEVIAQYEKRIQELERLLSSQKKKQPSTQYYRVATADKDTKTDAKVTINLTWRVGERAPCVMRRECDAIMSGGVVYCRHFRLGKIYLLRSSGDNWLQLPECPLQYFSMAIVNAMLTVVGGGSDSTSVFGLSSSRKHTYSNKIFSLIKRNWTELFPPMPTKRKGTVSLCTGTYLIVAGGEGEGGVNLATVEVMNIDISQWSTATDLPEPKNIASATIACGIVYVVGGQNQNRRETNSAYSCSLKALIDSTGSGDSQTHTSDNTVGYSFANSAQCTSYSTWKRIAYLPVLFSTSTTLRGQLLTVGGKTLNSTSTSTSAVHVYNPITDSWEVHSQMPSDLHLCLAAAMNDNQLLVVGGVSASGAITDSVYIANVV